jgi:hypothetical protein
MVERRFMVLAAVALLLTWGAVMVLMVDGAQAVSLL